MSLLTPVIALAARMCRPLVWTKIDFANAPEAFIRDSWKLAEQWLLEHLEDDNFPVDDEWLKANCLYVAGHDDDAVRPFSKFAGNYIGISFYYDEYQVFVECEGSSVTLGVVETRGDVRRFAKALNFELMTDRCLPS